MKPLLSVFFITMVFNAQLFAAKDPTVVVRSVTEDSNLAPVNVNGILRSRRDLLLPATIEGELLWVLEEGTRVEEGMVVAKVDDAQLILRLEEQKLLAARAGVTSTYLEGEVDRLLKLEKANLAARTQLAEMVSRRDLAQNDVLVAHARIAQLQETIGRTNIVSPVTGIVVEQLHQGGEYARRGDSVLRVVDPFALEVKAAVPMAYLQRLDQDHAVEVIVDETYFSATLRAIINAGTRSSQTFDVIVDVPSRLSQMFVSGQFVEVALPLKSSSNVLYVPRDAVVLRSEGNYVFRIGSDNVAERVSVILGEGQGNLVSVLGKLQAGDKVAIRGIERLEDGQLVNPVS
jgi:RND family efflux transporter MFP subunit